ncbi:nuclear receptor ROR-beta [Elysia marginata]|uniref:Nuclear receptor ROR-beta n=1 Tax=Elysia marginata TaxID=1093978 RepID=A0AAV4FDK4_9GAST|nr:nuclear receptor ROR-beta [Elysia marginata]
MSDRRYYPQCLEGIDVTIQGPEGNNSSKHPVKEFTCGVNNKYSTNSQDSLHTPVTFTPGEKKSTLSPEVSVVHDGDNISIPNRCDGPLDLSLKKKVLSDKKESVGQEQFSSLSAPVQTIFSSNPEHIFKIPLPPELPQSSSNSNYGRLIKAVNRTFEFSHQIPFLAQKPSIFQRKYNLYFDSVQSKSSKQSRSSTKTSSALKRHTSQLQRIGQSSKLSMMEPETPQKQPKMFNTAPQTIKDEPMETGFDQSKVLTNSLEAPNWQTNGSSVFHKHDLSALNGPMETAKKLQEQPLYSFPDSSTDTTQYSYLDLCRPHTLTSEPENIAFQKSSGMGDIGLGGVVLKQDNKMDSTQQCLPSTSHLNEIKDVSLCQVCGDQAAGFYCGAYICEACKKFFIRASKLKQMKYICLKQKNCKITKESRVHCQYCRYQKCLSLDMLYHKDGQKGEDKSNVQEIPCRVCSAPSSGFHFGALTCEGCKGFFRRMVNEREPGTYTCGKGGKCEVNSMTRNMCKACRYAKCLMIGMCIEGSRIGRQPNAVKHAISLEVKKQAAQRESSQERKYQNPSNLCADSTVSTYSFESRIAEGAEKVTQNEHFGFYQTSDNRSGNFHGKGRKKNNLANFGWRESREKDNLASSSTESLDLVGRADTCSDTLATATEKYGFSKSDYLSYDPHLISDMHTNSYHRGKEAYASNGASIGHNNYRSVLNQISPQSEPARHNVHLSSEIQEPNVFFNKISIEEKHIPSQFNRSEAIPIRANVHMPPSHASIPVYPRERRFSEDLELMNLNISMHGGENHSQLERRHSTYEGSKVLGLPVSGSLPSSWSLSKVSNAQDYSQNPFEHKSKPMAEQSVPLHSPVGLQPSSGLAPWEQNMNFHNASASEYANLRNPFFFKQINASSHAQFSSHGETNPEIQGFTKETVGEKEFVSTSDNSIQQSHYHHTQNIEENIHTEKQPSKGDWQYGSQNDSSSLAHTYQRQKALSSPVFVYNHEASSSHKQFSPCPQSFANPHANNGTNVFYEQKIKYSHGNYNSFSSETKHPNESSTGLKNRYDNWGWGNEVNIVNNEVHHSFKTPSHIFMRSRSPSPYKSDGRCGSEERSRSLSPYRLKRESSSHRNSLKHRHGSQGICNPSPYHRGAHGHQAREKEIITTKSSHRNHSLERSVPSPCVNGENELNRGRADTSLSLDSHNRPSQNSSSDQDPNVAQPNVTLSSNSINKKELDCSVVDVSSPKDLYSSTNAHWNYTNAYLDQEMEVCAKVLRSMCLVWRRDDDDGGGGDDDSIVTMVKFYEQRYNIDDIGYNNDDGGTTPMTMVATIQEEAKQSPYPADRLKDENGAWDLMMDYFHFHAKVLVRFAKKVPGFRDLKLDDQVKLLRSASYSCVLLNHTREYEPATGFYNYFNIPQKACIKLQELYPEFDVLHTHHKHCGILTKELNLTEKEYGYMSCMLLVAEECEGLDDPDRVRQLKDIIMAAFQQYEFDNFPNGALRFGQTLLRLSEFSQFAMQHNVAVGQVIAKRPTLTVPQLYAEMYS